MDGDGRSMDNIFFERLGHSFKYEVHLHELTDGFHADRFIGDWIGYYNSDRLHPALAGRTPVEACGMGHPLDMMHKADALPTYQLGQQQDVINRILAARSDSGIHLRKAARLSNKVGPPHSMCSRLLGVCS